ncbi:MAG: glutathione S-transferase family protein [Pseudomonadota bacterium]|nr:glutathione S-transferase family protein [Pseudomonadota bacterium]
MPYTLYYSPGTASLALHWMLIELGEPFEAVLADIETGGHKTPEFLAINPSGRVPALIVDDKAHAEVAAMLMLVAERDPAGRFDVPPRSPERADYLQRMVFLANTLQPAFRDWFYPEEPAGPGNVEAAQTQARQKVEGALARMDANLADGRTYMLGERMTALDFLATMLTRWSRNMPRPATDWPHLQRYVDRMRSLPSLIEVHKREGLTDWIGG